VASVCDERAPPSYLFNTFHCLPGSVGIHFNYHRRRLQLRV
jgi:hypothetical protein